MIYIFSGRGDECRCHYCDGGLQHWERGDNPWEQHAYHFPFCKFVIRMKGREFINEVRERFSVSMFSKAWWQDFQLRTVIDFNTMVENNYRGTCLIRHTKGPGKCVRLYRMSEYLGFILVNRNSLGPYIFCRMSEDVGKLGCRIAQVPLY